MASSDVVLSAPDVVSVPMDYDVPPAQEIVPKCVTATIDGTGAAGAFLPTLELLSPAGQVIFRSPTSTVVVAGASADVSWFQLSNPQASSTPPTTPYETLIFNTPGLQLYWKLDDAAGSPTIADSKGGNTGTIYDTVSLGQPPLADVTSGLFGAGMAGLKNVDALVDQTTRLMTVIVWLKTTAVAALNYLAWADTSSANGRWFQWFMTGAGHIGMTVFNGGAVGVGMGGSVVVNDGLKHMIAFTYGATNPVTGAGAVGSVYVDGVLDTATPLAMGGSGLAFTNHGILLGAQWRNAADGNSGINKLAGTLDEFALFNTTLTAAQLVAINAAGRI